mmetsp:Transcript_59325/g.190876  ORF Transcript_59325/g.190876 Transcript_59325/m.190876 type:complete len:234 (-) Transcript_59325:1261-1962(-)
MHQHVAASVRLALVADGGLQRLCGRGASEVVRNARGRSPGQEGARRLGRSRGLGASMRQGAPAGAGLLGLARRWPWGQLLGLWAWTRGAARSSGPGAVRRQPWALGRQRGTGAGRPRAAAVRGCRRQLPQRPRGGLLQEPDVHVQVGRHLLHLRHLKLHHLEGVCDILAELLHLLLQLARIRLLLPDEPLHLLRVRAGCASFAPEAFHLGPDLAGHVPHLLHAALDLTPQRGQ